MTHSAGPFYPSMVQASIEGVVGWGGTDATMTAALAADDASYLTCTPSYGYMYMVKASMFGFDVGDGTLTKLTVAMEGCFNGSYNAHIYGQAVYDTTVYGTQASLYGVTVGTTPTVASVVLTSGLPTLAEVNDDNYSTGFGVILSCTKSDYSAVICKADYVRVSIEWTAAPTVTTTAVTSITESGASSGGNVTDASDGTCTARGICWNTTGSPTTADSKTTDGSGTGAFTSTLSGLSPSLRYHVRAYATNAAGTNYGAEVDFDTPTYYKGAASRATVWPSALSAADVLADYNASAALSADHRDLSKGTVVISGSVKNRRGAVVPAHHVRAGWWIQNMAWQPDSAAPPPTLYITGHSVDLVAKKNALTIGQDWMEKEIGVREAELLAIPPTVVPDPVVEDAIDPYTPDAPADPSEPSTPVKEPGATYEFRGGGTPTGRAGAPEGMQWVSAGEAREPGGEWISQGEVLRPIGEKWSRR